MPDFRKSLDAALAKHPAPEERVAVVDDAPSGVGVERLTNACACGDCYHPVIGPNTDGEPCDFCRDCGCPSVDHTRMTEAAPAPLADAPDDVEALAAALSAMDDMEQVGTYEGHARAILASDWLAARDADLTARAEARGAAQREAEVGAAFLRGYSKGASNCPCACCVERSNLLEHHRDPAGRWCSCGGRTASEQCDCPPCAALREGIAAASYTRDGADGEADHG